MPDQPNLAQPPTFPDQLDIPPIPVTDTPPIPPPNNDVLDIPPIIADSSSPKRGNGKIIATILGILLLIGAVGAGVILVKQNQNIREKAGRCISDDECGENGRCLNSGYCVEGRTPPPCPNIAPPRCTGCTPNIDDSTGCVVGYECGASSSCPPPIDLCEGRSCLKIVPPTCHAPCSVHYDIDDCGCAINVYCDCPEPGCVDNGGGCRANSDCCSNYCIASLCGRESTPTPTPTGTLTPTPQPPMCSATKAYDTNWNLLTGAQLSALSAGSVIRFTISGIPADQIDKARFTINGVLKTETTNKKPGTNEYYIEYTIPAGVYSFTITAQIHHLTLGWF